MAVRIVMMGAGNVGLSSAASTDMKKSVLSIYENIKPPQDVKALGFKYESIGREPSGLLHETPIRAGD